MEHGATAIALPLIQDLTDFKAFQRSVKGTGFDYHLVPKQAQVQEDNCLNGTIGLEITGLIRGDKKGNTIKERINKKEEGLEKFSSTAFVVAVEFKNPRAEMILHVHS